MVSFFPSDPEIGRSIGAYNQGLNAETIARIQAGTAEEEARLRAQAQRQAAQQSYFANQQSNALEQQKLNQQGQFQQAQLANQRAQTAAQMEWQKALMQGNASEAEKDRKNVLDNTKLQMEGRISPAEAKATADADMNEQMARALEKTANNSEAEISTDANSLREAITERNKFKVGGEHGILSYPLGIGEKERTGIISKLSPSLQQSVMASGKTGNIDDMLVAANDVFKAKAATHAANAAKWQGEGLIAKNGNQWKAMYTNPFRKALRDATSGATTSTNAPANATSPSAGAPRTVPESWIKESNLVKNVQGALARGETNPAQLIGEARDAIARGANPAAVQSILQPLGLALPAPSYFGGTNTANVWPPLPTAPVAPAVPVEERVFPIPGMAAPGGYFNQGIAPHDYSGGMTIPGNSIPAGYFGSAR